MRVGSLFAGIGGFDLAAGWLGWRTAWFVEAAEFPARVLAHHWPGVPILGDIREVDFATLEPIDILCGGFPCQDISNAGKRVGIEGDRSGLWDQFARAIRELRPRYVVVENVAALLGRGLDRVLGDLAALGYDAEWAVLSAADVGAPHLRERVWIVAYPAGPRRGERECGEGRTARDETWRSRSNRLGATLADADSESRGIQSVTVAGSGETASARDGGEALADSDESRRGEGRTGRSLGVGEGLREQTLSDAASHLRRASRNDGREAPDGSSADSGRTYWATEPDVGRMAHGIPARVDRLRGLGNAIVPLCAVLGPFRRIIEIEEEDARKS